MRILGVLVGPFNIIRRVQEWFPQGRITRGMRKFNNFIATVHLMEIPLSSDKFTWSREGSVIPQSLIDRFLISNIWDETFANTRVTRQVRILSNHFPILLEVGSFKWRPPPFRLKGWLDLKGVLQVIENSLDFENNKVGLVLSFPLNIEE